MAFQFKNGWGYQGDRMTLPVADVEAAIPFYEKLFAFKVESRGETPHKSAVLERNGLKIALNENGGDPTQDGCFFEVDDVMAAFTELKSKGLKKEVGDAISETKHGETKWKVFFVVAPDGLCYCLGERIP